MSLISCPKCHQKISDKSSECTHCHFSFVNNAEEIERLKVLNFRKYRDKMYRLKMLSFIAMAIALIGTVPMLWDYLKAIDYGFQANILNHWGIKLLVIGFAMYVIVRVLMLTTKRNFKSKKS